jgi:hypothetical protein
MLMKRQVKKVEVHRGTFGSLYVNIGLPRQAFGPPRPFWASGPMIKTIITSEIWFVKGNFKERLDIN